MQRTGQKGVPPTSAFSVAHVSGLGREPPCAVGPRPSTPRGRADFAVFLTRRRHRAEGVSPRAAGPRSPRRAWRHSRIPGPTTNLAGRAEHTELSGDGRPAGRAGTSRGRPCGDVPAELPVGGFGTEGKPLGAAPTGPSPRAPAQCPPPGRSGVSVRGTEPGGLEQHQQAQARLGLRRAGWHGRVCLGHETFLVPVASPFPE